MTEIYHQLGFRYQWNLKSLENDGTGDGVIIGPRYMAKDVVENLPLPLRQKSLFDPQYFVPGAARGKLSTYGFFPEIISTGFQTTEWTKEHAYQSALGCLDFQVNCDFRYLIAPTRFREGMPSDYTESQTSAFVEPFINAYKELNNNKPLLLQLILTDQMLKDRAYLTEILNWVTGLEKIEGLYLIYQNKRVYKQIQDIEFLISIDFFVQTLKQAGMIVVIGYMNTESVPLLCSGADAMTLGIYENMRMFNITSFEEPEDKGRGGGPNARIYIPRLLQWVEHTYLGAIKRAVGNLEEFVSDNEYRVTLFEPSYEWHFTKPDPYMHYLIAFSEQFRRFSSTHNTKDRVQLLKNECSEAINEYKKLEDGGAVFDTDSGNRHLTSWLTFLNQR